MEPPAADLRTASLGQIAIVTKDLQRTTAFYRDVLGFSLLMEFPGLAFFDCGGVRLMLSAPEKPEFDHPASTLYFRVADIRSTHASLAGRGVRFEDQPHLVARLPDHELWMTFFRDSEENLLALMSEVR